MLLGRDEKRLHTFEELRHATEGWLSATSENMTLHMDMKARKVAPFPPDIHARIQAVVACACRRAAARRHRPQGRDAQEIGKPQPGSPASCSAPTTRSHWVGGSGGMPRCTSGTVRSG